MPENSAIAGTNSEAAPPSTLQLPTHGDVPSSAINSLDVSPDLYALSLPTDGILDAST